MSGVGVAKGVRGLHARLALHGTHIEVLNDMWGCGERYGLRLQRWRGSDPHPN